MWKWIFAILGLLYVLNPFDLMPDWLIGWGWLDDLVVFGFLVRLFFVRSSRGKRFRRQNDPGRGQRERKGAGGRGQGSNFDARQRPAQDWDPYQILSLSRDATKSEIKEAYRRLASQYHPDKVSHLGEEFRELAEIKFKRIQQAYRELTRHSSA